MPRVHLELGPRRRVGTGDASVARMRVCTRGAYVAHTARHAHSRGICICAGAVHTEASRRNQSQRWCTQVHARRTELTIHGLSHREEAAAGCVGPSSHFLRRPALLPIVNAVQLASRPRGAVDSTPPLHWRGARCDEQAIELRRGWPRCVCAAGRSRFQTKQTNHGKQ